jgi:hypothetical protein
MIAVLLLSMIALQPTLKWLAVTAQNCSTDGCTTCSSTQCQDAGMHTAVSITAKRKSAKHGQQKPT